ncbi:hypothetical protein IV203_034365 [Nitzschia inconspicua]|uniref:Uncharacterized protein n=1 Tax=Nitzschia inconspicua TaxID=303405 RepID=A0A9K3P909_9STRA|nr:hypothetical protein IV203_022838 [Nitzschia inconspicua]KAG7373641.1 hypothetical protein IV203_034365 [Nitzschia inconspicua]
MDIVYVQRPLPLLSREQTPKHVKFSKLVVDAFWGLSTNSKVLLIHYDEKGFHEFVICSKSRCQEVRESRPGQSTGVPPLQLTHQQGHVWRSLAMHLKEIWKTEVIGLKLCFYRCNAAKIAKKRVRKSRGH